MEQLIPLDLSVHKQAIIVPVIKHIVKSRQRQILLSCLYCSKSFDRPSLLIRHTRTHTGERPFHCAVCKKAFSTSSSLNTHQRIHSGEKPHICPICFKAFTASSNLYYHRMTHMKVSKVKTIKKRRKNHPN